MTDRELLEAAAKAAGIEWYGYAGDDECECRYFDIGEEDVVRWNPLTDDGDALRLAVALRIEIRKYGTVWEVVRYGVSSAHRVLDVKPPADDSTEALLAAHRRAIVRAAATQSAA